MKNFTALFFIAFILMAFSLFSFEGNQTNFSTTELETLPFEQTENYWYDVKDGFRMTKNDVLNRHASILGLGENDFWKLKKSETDELGITHTRYQLYHHNIVVFGAQLIIHEKDGFVKSFNGKWAKNLEVKPMPMVSFFDAIDKGFELKPAQRYMWEDSFAEALKKDIERNPLTTFFPKPTLVFVDPQLSNNKDNYRLAYEMTIYATQPLFQEQIFIDAQTGELLLEVELVHTANNVVGTAETFYHGTQEIITDSIGPNNYILSETTRGYGIQTYDLNNGTEFGNDTINFFDTDNYWNNTNADFDQVATDAHWSAEKTFDYLNEILGWTGIDGDSMKLVNAVHFGENVVNAFWNGNWCTLGDGDGGSNWTPLTSLDVVGHEFAHGVTQNTANLIYSMEYGALNESFSDIFGTAIEFYADPATGDYYIGEDFNLTGNGFRSMANPNIFDHPDTYYGTYWAPLGGGDNGGVHTNSGVQNFWWYLLSEGGTGTNDNNFDYSVEGLGRDTATIIAFRNLRYYLTEMSEFIDARHGSVRAAEDLYGNCSYEAQQTTKAWRAVGVGNLIDSNDFELISILDPQAIECGLTNNEKPTVNIRYNGCTLPIAANINIPIVAQVGNGPLFTENIQLPNAINGGDTIVHTFATGISGLEVMGTHELKIWVDYPLDPISNNNIQTIEIDNILEQNVDFEGYRVTAPLSACDMMMNAVSTTIKFQGCDSIAAGDDINISYQLEGSNIVTETTTIPYTLYRGDDFSYTFNTQSDFTNALGNNDLEVWVNYDPDFIISNDSTLRSVANPYKITYSNIITYDADELSKDSFYIFTTDVSNGSISDDYSVSGDYSYKMSGGDPAPGFADGILERPSDTTAWMINESLKAEMCVCVNATAMTAVELSFDLRQTYGFYFLTNQSLDVKAASSMRVTIDGAQVSPTYNPNTHFFDPWDHHILNLDDYAGTKFEVCFETRNFTSEDFDDVGDKAYIDNVELTGVVSNNELNLLEEAMSIYPNPVSTNAVVALTGTKEVAGQLELIDMNGRLLYTRNIIQQQGINNYEIELASYPAGLYYVKLNFENRQGIKSLVKF